METSLCGRAKCCPTIKKTGYGYLIRDDFGGQVNLKPEELKNLVKIFLGD